MLLGSSILQNPSVDLFIQEVIGSFFQQVFLVNLSHPCLYIINQMIISKRCVSLLTHKTPWESDTSCTRLLLDYFDIAIHILTRHIDKQYLCSFLFVFLYLLFLWPSCLGNNSILSCPLCDHLPKVLNPLPVRDFLFMTISGRIN